MKGSILFASVFFLIFAVTGCGPKVLRDMQAQGASPVPFDLLLHSSGEYRGKLVMAGGYVLEIRNAGTGSDMIVIEAPLDSMFEPGGKDESRGRFIFRSKGFLDPEVYAKDRKVTVSGVSAGISHESLGEGRYAYPVIEAGVVYLWPKAEELQPPYYYRHPYYYRDYPWDYPWYPGPYRHYPYRPYPWW